MVMDAVLPGSPTHFMYTNDDNMLHTFKEPLNATTIQLYTDINMSEDWSRRGISIQIKLYLPFTVYFNCSWFGKSPIS